MKKMVSVFYKFIISYAWLFVKHFLENFWLFLSKVATLKSFPRHTFQKVSHSHLYAQGPVFHFHFVKTVHEDTIA